MARQLLRTHRTGVYQMARGLICQAEGVPPPAGGRLRGYYIHRDYVTVPDPVSPSTTVAPVVHHGPPASLVSPCDRCGKALGRCGCTPAPRSALDRAVHRRQDQDSAQARASLAAGESVFPVQAGQNPRSSS